jgi:hypothetical protein
VTTEESYTSKTSFVNGDVLASYADRAKAAETPDQAPQTEPVILTGRRSSTADETRANNEPFAVMDVVALWTTDQHLTVNSKRVAVREVLHGMVRKGTLAQADEFGYRRGKAS